MENDQRIVRLEDGLCLAQKLVEDYVEIIRELNRDIRKYRSKPDLEELVFNALGYGPEAAKGPTVIQKEVRRRRTDVSQALHSLYVQGRVEKRGPKNKPNFYRIAHQKGAGTGCESSGTAG